MFYLVLCFSFGRVTITDVTSSFHVAILVFRMNDFMSSGRHFCNNIFDLGKIRGEILDNSRFSYPGILLV